MKKAILYTWAFMLITASASAYWSATPVSELSKKSSEVVIGKVVNLKANLKIRRVIVTLEVHQLLKGTHKKKNISFDAPFSLISDVVIFPLPNSPSSYKIGENCLVFIKKVDKRFRMTMDTDGKYLLDKDMKNYRLEYLSKDKWKPLSDVIKQIK